MTHAIQARTPPIELAHCVRAVRPSLLDPRFIGDPWIENRDGMAAVCLDSYLLTSLTLAAIDLPSLNRVWTKMRQQLRLARRASEE